MCRHESRIRILGLLLFGVAAEFGGRRRVPALWRRLRNHLDLSTPTVTGETLGFKDLCRRTDPENGLQLWDNAVSNASGWNQGAGSCDKSTPATPPPPVLNTWPMS